MEASTQPQPAVPVPTTPDMTTTQPAPKKSNWPAIISLLLFFLVVIILAVLFLMSRNNAANDTQNIVSEPVTQVTTTTPETTGGSTSTAPAPVADNTVNPNNFDSRLFYLNFTSPAPVTSDTTTRTTHADGTTFCFQENASGTDIDITVNEGAPECLGATGGQGLESLNETSADSKSFGIGIFQDDVNSNRFLARIVYATQDNLNMSVYINLRADTQAEVKSDAIALVKSLSLDNTKLKTELTDKIVTP